MQENTPMRRGGLGPVERAVRIAGGALLAVVAVSFALDSSGLAVVVWIALALLGLDFVVTGARGYCPLYARLGVGLPSSHSHGSGAA